MILSYASFLWYAMRKVYIIFQALLANKPKYIKTMLKQLHIFDIKAMDP